MNFAITRSFTESITKTHCRKECLCFLTIVNFCGFKQSRFVVAYTDCFETSISWDARFKHFRDDVSIPFPLSSSVCPERTLARRSNFSLTKNSLFKIVSPVEVLLVSVELKHEDSVFKTCCYAV
jgi:hypothetical protein